MVLFQQRSIKNMQKTIWLFFVGIDRRDCGNSLIAIIALPKYIFTL